MVKVSVWNVRGINDVSKKKEVKKLIVDNGLEVCALVETKVCCGKLKSVCDEVFGSWDWISNNASCKGRTRIIVGWNSSVVRIDYIEQSEQAIHCRLSQVGSNKMFHCTFVYASNEVTERRELWNYIACHKVFIKNEAWVVMGDFNVSLNPNDSSRGTSTITRGMKDFRECVNVAELEDINQSGMRYTWIQIYAWKF